MMTRLFPGPGRIIRWQAHAAGKLPYFLLTATVLMRVTSSATASLSYVGLAAYALSGRTQAIQALALSWLFTMVNPALVPDASAASAGRFFVIFAAALSVMMRGAASGPFITRLNLSTAFLGMFLLLHAVLFSSIVDVSILKSISWILVVITLLSAWSGLPADRRAALYRQLENGLILLLLLSLPLLAVPAIGYLVNGTGFQGVLNHPQAFGPTVALAGGLVGGRVLATSRPRWRDIALLMICLIMILLSEARIAGFAVVLALLSTALLLPRCAGGPRRSMLPGLHSRRIQATALMSMIGILSAMPLLITPLSNYLFKRSESTSLLAAADASRGELVHKMVINIVEMPFTGIGFGIASHPSSMVVERDAVFGLPLGAQVEKGVMPLAVLEELGAFGAVAVLLWLAMMLRHAARAGAAQFALVLTVLLVNLGESMFFSVGGMGMLLLVLLSGAVVGGQTMNKELAHG